VSINIPIYIYMYDMCMCLYKYVYVFTTNKFEMCFNVSETGFVFLHFVFVYSHLLTCRWGGVKRHVTHMNANMRHDSFACVRHDSL